jgi:hypothetical protein
MDKVRTHGRDNRRFLFQATSLNPSQFFSLLSKTRDAEMRMSYLGRGSANGTVAAGASAIAQSGGEGAAGYAVFTGGVCSLSGSVTSPVG